MVLELLNGKASAMTIEKLRGSFEDFKTGWVGVGGSQNSLTAFTTRYEQMAIGHACDALKGNASIDLHKRVAPKKQRQSHGRTSCPEYSS